MDRKTLFVIIASLLGLGLVAFLIFAPDIEVWRQQKRYSEHVRRELL